MYFFIIYGIIKIEPDIRKELQLAHFIFSLEKFYALLEQEAQKTREINKELLTRLGVKPAPKDVVTVLIISKDSFAGHEAFFTLGEECERIYGKKINLERIRLVILRSLDQASKSPHLERASFILILGEDLLGVENYPELEQILYPKW